MYKLSEAYQGRRIPNKCKKHICLCSFLKKQDIFDKNNYNSNSYKEILLSTGIHKDIVIYILNIFKNKICTLNNDSLELFKNIIISLAHSITRDNVLNFINTPEIILKCKHECDFIQLIPNKINCLCRKLAMWDCNIIQKKNNKIIYSGISHIFIDGNYISIYNFNLPNIIYKSIKIDSLKIKV